MENVRRTYQVSHFSVFDIATQIVERVLLIHCSISRDQVPGNPNGGVAQLGERLPCKQEVMGSTPTISTSDEEIVATMGS